MKTSIACAAAMAAALSLAASPDPTGFWSGAIEAPGRKLSVMLEIDRPDEAWEVELYAPEQGIRGARLIEIAIEQRDVGFRIPLTPGEPTFRGLLSEDGSTIAGTFTQAGQAMPFRLERSEKPDELKRDPYAEFLAPGVPAEGLVGTWHALMEAGLHRMRLVLTVRRDAEGRLEGSFESLDQGTAGAGVYGFDVEGDSVAFQLITLNAEFSGTVAADGSQMHGTWRQNGQEIPLTFRRRQ